MDTSSNSHTLEIELTEDITNITNLDDFIQDLMNSITQNINNLSGGNNNQSSFSIEYEIINSEEQTNKKEITNKDILTHLGSYKRINIDDDLIKHKSSCPVCLDDYTVGEYKRCLSCSHSYHKKCIDKWIKKCNTCPECRKECIVI